MNQKQRYNYKHEPTNIFVFYNVFELRITGDKKHITFIILSVSDTNKNLTFTVISKRDTKNATIISILQRGPKQTWAKTGQGIAELSISVNPTTNL